MSQQTTLGRLALLLFPLGTFALPGPQIPAGGPGRGGNGNPAPDPVLPWVTVDPIGLATTITPTVFTTSDVRTTANAPPGDLTSTATYTLSPGGTDRPDLASTYTGLAPVATATSTSDKGGSFLACNRGQGTDEPFCLPKRGSILHPGRTYYVTWSPSYFAPPNISIAFQAQYFPADTGGYITDFTTNYFSASVGFYAWTIPIDFLTSSSNHNISSQNISLSLVYEDTETTNPNDIKVLPGPNILVMLESQVPNHAPKGPDKSYAAAIAVPIIVVILLIALGGFCFFKYKKTGLFPVPAFSRKRNSTGGGGGAGYGERQSRAQRVGSGSFGATNDKQGAQANTVGIQLTDRDSWSPTTAASAPSGRNVFREEIQRQEAAAQRR
ncbi:hypothetical protein QBC37DRAFT_426815 [Rhypophila decipiens]|uniref:Uncharacterized protein n=1 Tax=Rhypophila decipiens TaxID=261697 RepID=A0AAN7B826_9PEZI|nr:hypothetical protein QBC37DRAFT_426815 [Rhypophila decipiens]